MEREKKQGTMETRARTSQTSRKRRLASASGSQLRGIIDVVNVNLAIFIEDDSPRPGAFLSRPNNDRGRCSHRSRINGTLEAMEWQAGNEVRIVTICRIVQGPAVEHTGWAAVLLGRGAPVAVAVGVGTLILRFRVHDI